MYKGGALPLPYTYSPDDHCVGATLAVARSRILINGRPLPLPLGEVAERSEDGEGRNVKKTCRWHAFLTFRSRQLCCRSIHLILHRTILERPLSHLR